MLQDSVNCDLIIRVVLILMACASYLDYLEELTEAFQQQLGTESVISQRTPKTSAVHKGHNLSHNNL